MVRVLFEISLPESTLPRIRAALTGSALPAGIAGRLDPAGGSGGCQSPALGGAAGWTPCRISLEAQDTRQEALGEALAPLKEVLVAAAREGRMELFAVPATAQIGDGYYRFRDLLDVRQRLG
ncbi:MAG: hypothetical protein IH608_11525 [Proteobacteria bacterium]|nr:hypothetical protein [Pseudomonadota bacterium]